MAVLARGLLYWRDMDTMKTAMEDTMYTLQRMFNGNRSEAKTVSRHRTLAAAVKAAARWRAGEGWGARVIDRTGSEIDLLPEMRRLGLG